MKVKNKVIVITGGGNGVGRELVLTLLEKGAKIAAVDINGQALKETNELAGSLQGNLSTHILDITDKEAVPRFSEQVIVSHGNVDALINNAGIIQPFVRVADLDYSTIERVVNVNFYGTLYMTKAFLPYLLKRPEAHVVNISSMGGFVPFPGQSVYGAAKAAVKMLTEGLRAELFNTNVNVTVVFPGAVNTNIKNNSGIEDEPKSGDKPPKLSIKPLPPAKAAQKIIGAIEKNRSRIFVGADSRCLNLMYRLNPNFATKLIANLMKSHIPD